MVNTPNKRTYLIVDTRFLNVQTYLGTEEHGMPEVSTSASLH